MNQKQVDQDMADEMSEKFDFRGEVMRGKKNDW